MNWDKATDIILYASFAILAVFAILGACQLIKRKSIKRVDRPLLAMLAPLGLMTATYIVFDKLLILNTRPDGSGEPSFPSTHAMVVATIFAIVGLTLKYYVKSKTLRVIIDIIMLALTVVVAVGRVLADKHWASDVFAGLVFAGLFTLVYYLIIRSYKNVQHLHEDH